MPSNHLILCCPLLLLPSIFPSIGIFSTQLGLHVRWPKDWNFSISPSNEYSGLIPLELTGLISWSLLKLMSIESVMPSNHLIFCRPLLLLPSIFPNITVFPNELTLCIKWPKYWNFSISPSNEYSGLISFRIDWFDLLAIQGTLKSLFQCHNLKPSILWCSAFFMVQLSNLYMTTGKTIALTRWTFTAK